MKVNFFKKNRIVFNLRRSVFFGFHGPQLKKLKALIVIMMGLLTASVSAQDEVYKEVTLEKFKLQNKIKNLILQRNEAQENLLFLGEEIEEMKVRTEKINQDKEQISESIKRNFNKFAVDLIKYKVNDSSSKNLIRLITFNNWNHEFDRLKELSQDLQKTNESLIKSKAEMRKTIITTNSLALRIQSDIDDLDVMQKYLRDDLEKSGPDSLFFHLIGRLKWPVKKATLIGSKGFYKIPNERVYDYNEGLKFEAERGEPIYPIASGILEGEIYVPNLGQVLIVKHTENIRSFYIGAVSSPGILINDHLSPDKQFGLVKSPVLELKLRFDTEALDPSDWIKYRR